MSRLFLCHPLWSGSFWIYFVLSLIILALFVAFAIRVCRTNSKDFLKFVIKTEPEIVTIGPLSYLAMVLLVMVFILVYPLVDHELGLNFTPYPQHVDLNVKTSLKTLRNRFEGYSNRVIHLEQAIEELEIEGEYDGCCVADMFYAICLRHPDKLSCDWPWSKPVLYIRVKSP